VRACAECEEREGRTASVYREQNLRWALASPLEPNTLPHLRGHLNASHAGCEHTCV
jgi:hypothetical protein